MTAPPRGRDATASPSTDAGDAPREVEVAIIGGGFAGLGMGIRLRQAGMTDFTVLERASEVGGTWRDNSYPGAAVDVRSHLYSFSFAPNPDWTEVFAGQAELWDYIRRVTREYGVDAHVRTGTEVLGGAWDAAAQRWRLETSGGPVVARFVVSATGPLSNPVTPDLPGLESFAGHTFHSGAWDHDHDLGGRRVGVIGTGSSAAQFVPEIQPEVERLTVFQRTPHWTFPRLNRRITGLEKALYRRFPRLQRLARYRQFLFHELVIGSAVQNPWFTEAVSKARMRMQVRDPQLRRRLTPDFRMGCKRIVITDAYHPALAAPNVDVVGESIAQVTPDGVRTADGTEHRLDTLIFATGYEIMPVADPLRGREGQTLTERWSGGRSAHRGTTVSGFPNLFLLVGPNTATGHTSILLYAEPQIEYVIEAIEHTRRHGLASVEVRREAQEEFDAGLRERLTGSVWVTGGCRSWYLDEHGHPSALWPGLTWSFRRALARFDHENYVMEREPATSPVGTG